MTLLPLLRSLRGLLAGRRFERSVARNVDAAERLDAAVRELLRR